MHHHNVNIVVFRWPSAALIYVFYVFSRAYENRAEGSYQLYHRQSKLIMSNENNYLQLHDDKIYDYDTHCILRLRRVSMA